MATSYPTALDTLPNPSSTTSLDTGASGLNHSAQHTNTNDAIEALQAKVGVENSSVTTSHDYRIRTHNSSTVAHGATGAVVGTENFQTLTNKTISAASNTFDGIQPTDAALTALAGLNATAGLLTRTAASTYTKRTLASANSKLGVTSGNSAGGNPTLAIAEANFTGIAQSGVDGLTGQLINSRFNALEGIAFGAGWISVTTTPTAIAELVMTVPSNSTSVLICVSYDALVTNALFIGQLRIDGVVYPNPTGYNSTNLQSTPQTRRSIFNYYAHTFDFAGTHLVEMLAWYTGTGPVSCGASHSKVTVSGDGIF